MQPTQRDYSKVSSWTSCSRSPNCGKRSKLSEVVGHFSCSCWFVPYGNLCNKAMGECLHLICISCSKYGLWLLILVVQFTFRDQVYVHGLFADYSPLFKMFECSGCHIFILIFRDSKRSLIFCLDPYLPAKFKTN